MKKQQEYIVSGGGSGGHITPTLAVAAELKRADPSASVRYILDRRSPYRQTVAQHPAVDVVHCIFAGKLRRYHGVSTSRQLLDVPTLLRNIRDIFYLLVGIGQALYILAAHRPQALFIKGGFVGVPVGLAAALLRIPYVTHDSDKVPGLANRIIAPWARIHAVGMPVSNYAYDPAKTIEVGVPIDEVHYLRVTESAQAEYKQALGIPSADRVVLVIGGGGGSRAIDDVMESVAPTLLEMLDDVHIVHIFGKLNQHMLDNRYAGLPNGLLSRIHKISYTDRLYTYSGAADVIVTRAGATNMAEFAAQAKACVVIPAAHLTGGHQLKNAQVYADAQAAVVLDESVLAATPATLTDALMQLLNNRTYRKKLGDALHVFGRPHAATKLAALVIKQGR